MTRQTVLIPLASRGLASGELLELYGEPSPDPAKDDDERKRGIEPVVEALRPINLHASGQRAMAAVQKLLDAKAKRHFALETCKIRFANRPSSSLIEGRSAELGIALLLLMEGSDGSPRSVIATGVLEVLPGRLDFDARVEPVESLDAKLHLILEAKRRGHLHKAITKVLIPATWPQEGAECDENLSTHREAVRELAEVGLAVIPVRTLREAAQQLDISLTDRTAAWRRALLVGLLALGAGAAGIVGMVNQTILVRFEAEPTTGIPAKPFLVCTDEQGRFAGYEPIPLAGMVPQAPISGILGWRIRFGQRSTLDAALFDWFHPVIGYGRYHVAVAFIGEQSGLFLVPTEAGAAQIRKAPDEVWKWQQQLGKPAEAGVLVFLAKRFGEFDLSTLRRQFNERFKAPFDRTLTSDFLAQQASGSLRYFFESREGSSPCEIASSATRMP
jgi:hypothetical protein